MPASSRLNLAIGLPLRNQPALSNLLIRLYDPSSPDYHHYLSPEQFTALFGPTDQDYQAVCDFAKAKGFTIIATYPNRLLLDVSASVQQIEKALHVNLRLYRHPTESRVFYAPDVEPSLDLVAPVRFIGGLDNFVLPQPMHLQPSSRPSPSPNVGSAPDGGYLGTDFRNAYVPGVPLTGAGQTVALLEFDGFYQSDITAYEDLAGLPHVPLQTVLLDGFEGTPASSTGNLEVSLDMEMVISMAPGISKLIVCEAGPNGLAEDVLSRMANDNLAKQISSSWNWSGYDPNSEAIFQQFAAQGQTYFNATGDIGAFVGPITRIPSDDPYVVQVGGTALTMNGSGAAYVSETAASFSSGGISTTYPMPAWQQGVSMSANLGSTTMRNVPDVAMAAAGYVKYGNGASGSHSGTSFSAPLWAGFTALMNQQAVANGLPTVGFINPAIYHIGTNANYTSCFHDITVGNNTSGSSPGKFYAVAGYDLVTGWGSPSGSNLINVLSGPPLTGPVVTSNSFTLVGETCPNGAADPGETVVFSFGLKNIGIADTTNMVATLLSTGGVVSPSGPVTYGPLTVGGAAATRLFTFTASGNCGATNTATLRLQDGTANLGTVTFPFVLGNPGGPVVSSESFDGVSPPALPAGWTTSSSGAGAAWTTTSAQSDTSPNSAFAPDPPSPSDKSLFSPPFTIQGAAAQLTFRHRFSAETGYDGGALEISIAGGAFVDILAAGGSFVTNGYNRTISNCCGNPLGNRGAWSGDSGGFITTIVNLPAAATGQTNRLRWRFCSDASVGAIGWYVDTVSRTEGSTCCTENHPLIQSITRSYGQTLIGWASSSNRVYRLQYTTNVSTGAWNDVTGDILATGSTASKLDPDASSPGKFYRVIALP
jgi:hypothetical protein